jgi:hypothetical protein
MSFHQPKLNPQGFNKEDEVLRQVRKSQATMKDKTDKSARIE